MLEVAIAVPGSMSESGRREYLFLKSKYKQDLKSELKYVHGQDKTLGVALDATGIPDANKFIVQYPQSLNVIKPALNGGDLEKSASVKPDDFYGRSLDIGVRTLAQAVETIAVSAQFKPTKLTLIGYSQGAEIVQIFMASAKTLLANDIYKWFSNALKISTLIANPIRRSDDNTNQYAIDSSGNKSKMVLPDGSLFRHGLSVNIDLNDDVAYITHNILREDDVIASHKTNSQGKIKKLSTLVMSAKKSHTDYRVAEPIFRKLYREYNFGNDLQELKVNVFSIPQTDLDRDETYRLAKNYILARTGTSTYIREGFALESMGEKSDYLRERMMLVNDQYGALGKTVQTAVWARASQICAYKLHSSPYFHNARLELRSFRHLGIVGPYEYIQRVGQVPGVRTALFAEISELGRVIGKKPNAQILDIVLSGWKMIPDHGLPEWIFGRSSDGSLTSQDRPTGWDGNPNTPGVKEFLEAAVKSTEVGGSNLAKDVTIFVASISTPQQFLRHWCRRASGGN